MLIGLTNRDTSELDSDITILNGLLSLLRSLEIDDSKALVAHGIAHLLRRHETALDRSILLDNRLQNGLLGTIVWNFGQPDTFRIRYLLLFLLLLSCLLSLKSSCVESALLWTLNCSIRVFLALHFLECLNLVLQVFDLYAIHIVAFALGLPVSELCTQVFFLSLDLVVRMPYIISVQHRDMGIASDGLHAGTDAKRVKNGISLSALSVALGHGDLRLQDAAVVVLDNGA